ncbi:hypothetical protein GIB67_029878 [Kingdonia uniflora]|uniref:Bushy growth protein n=1 Tax=Kingdonia uniflora TaxID=39325 RepID=A0A7J7NJR6_9MAGN|nr:hypothetical protein GIB67_029878 [Kingdonia uniflora]
MKSLQGTSSKQPIKFRIPTAENLVPIRLDIDLDGHKFKDAFTWNPSGILPGLYPLISVACVFTVTDPDSEVVVFAKRTVKDLKLPQAFVTQIAQSIQAQLVEFRSLEGQEMFAGERIVPLKLDLLINNTIIRDQFLWDLNNFESDPEEFARTLCKDLDIIDPEVGPAVAVAIREQLYEIAVQSVASARETRVSKKGRRGTEHMSTSKSGGAALDLMKLFGGRSSIVRKRKEWDLYEPIVDILSNEEVEALNAREERNARLKKRFTERDDFY